MKKFLSTLLVATALSSSAFAAGDAVDIPKQGWSFNGAFGTYDRPALQRGFQVYKGVCSACHGMKFLAYRNLTEIGLTDLQVKAIAAQYSVMDGPDDEGEMFERPGEPKDRFVSPYPNEQAARASNNGAYPPDLSLIAKARQGGADYIYALLTGYEQAPADFKLGDGMHYNAYFAGHQIAMAKPLMDDQVMYADGTDATVEQMSRDLSQFLMWAAEPKLEQRKQMGAKVMLFLAVLASILYLAKRKIWRDVEH